MNSSINSSHCPPKHVRSKRRKKKKRRNANVKRNLQIQTAPKTPNIFRAKLNFILDIKYYIIFGIRLL